MVRMAVDDGIRIFMHAVKIKLLLRLHGRQSPLVGLFALGLLLLVGLAGLHHLRLENHHALLEFQKEVVFRRTNELQMFQHIIEGRLQLCCTDGEMARGVHDELQIFVFPLSGNDIHAAAQCVVPLQDEGVWLALLNKQRIARIGFVRVIVADVEHRVRNPFQHDCNLIVVLLLFGPLLRTCVRHSEQKRCKHKP